jgi:quinol monooxygenase YgiN
MHARVTTLSVQPDKVAEATRIYNESVLPAIRAAAGNRSAMLLIDPASGKALSITVWETEADGQAYDTNGTYREQVAKVAPLFSGPPSLATYEVGAQG